MLFSRNKNKIKKITCLSVIFAGVLSSASFLSSCSDPLKPEVNSILLSTDADKEIRGIICEQGEFNPNFNIVFDDTDGVPIHDNIDKVYYEFENNPYPKNIKIDKDSGVISWAFGQSFSNIGLDVCAVLQSNSEIISNDVHFELNTTFERITEIELEYNGSYKLDGTKGVSGASDNKIFHSFLPTNADQTTPIKSNLTPCIDSKQFTSDDIYIQDDYIKWSDNLDVGTYKFNISYQTMDGKIFKSLQQFTLNIDYPIPSSISLSGTYEYTYLSQKYSSNNIKVTPFCEGSAQANFTVGVTPEQAINTVTYTLLNADSSPCLCDEVKIDPSTGNLTWIPFDESYISRILTFYVEATSNVNPNVSDRLQINVEIQQDSVMYASYSNPDLVGTTNCPTTDSGKWTIDILPVGFCQDVEFSINTPDEKIKVDKDTGKISWGAFSNQTSDPIKFTITVYSPVIDKSTLVNFTLSIVLPDIKQIKLNWVNQSGSTTSKDLYGFINREGTSYPEHTKVTINPSDASSSSLAWSCWTSEPDVQLDFDSNSGIISWSQIPSYLSNESLPVFIRCYDKNCPSTNDTIQLDLHIRSEWSYIGSEYFAGDPDFLIDQPQPISQSNGVSTCYWSVSNFSYSLDPVDPTRLAAYLISGEYVPYSQLLTSGLVRNLSLNFNFNIRLATGESFDTPISISDQEIANNFGKFTIDTKKISPRLFSPYDENVTEMSWQHVMHYIYRYFCYDYKFNFVTSINGVKDSFYSLKDCVEVRYDMTHQVFTTRINTKNVPLVTMGDFKISFKLQSIDRESFVLLRDVTGAPEDLNPIAHYEKYTESITTYVGTISTITPAFEIYSYNN